VLSLEVDGGCEVACLFLGECLHFMLELLDRDVRIDGSLLLRFDHLVEVAELCVESDQRRPVFLQALRLAVLRL
jgi:hypothetical protein